MDRFWAFSILLQAFVYYVECSSTSTTGHFFQKTSDNDDDTKNKDGGKEIFLKEEFFTCNGEKACSDVARSSSSGYQMVKNGEALSKMKENWKKIWPLNCKELYNRGMRKSGVYEIQPQKDNIFKVYCDLEKDGGGWTVIQRRIDGSTNFYRNWTEYKKGFGDLSHNMWIGLDNLHSLAAAGKDAILHVDLKHYNRGNTTFYARYGRFEVSGEADGYRLTVGKFSGTAGDSLNANSVNFKHNGMKFSTHDVDNDINNSNCAEHQKGGWWYAKCHASNLNGLYPATPIPKSKYMSWLQLDHDYGNIYFSEMKIKSN
eukprot:Seg2243.3 transcript_id=Seg2243.3/GoldUCD/mRNA.D3Y31 product=Ficolin-1 protein_id=Seg2243.3/GoldUCD/D3Y31